MPYNVGNNHWTTIYVNYESRGAVYFDSLGYSSGQAKRLMVRFFEMFSYLFQGEGPFRWEEGTKCAKQRDISSCGIYTVRNCLDLLDRRVPSEELLHGREIKNFRRNGAELLKRKMKKAEGHVQNSPHVTFDSVPKVSYFT